MGTGKDLTVLQPSKVMKQRRSSEALKHRKAAGRSVVPKDLIISPGSSHITKSHRFSYTNRDSMSFGAVEVRLPKLLDYILQFKNTTGFARGVLTNNRIFDGQFFSVTVVPGCDHFRRIDLKYYMPRISSLCTKNLKSLSESINGKGDLRKTFDETSAETNDDA